MTEPTVRVMIASPLEPEHIATIRRALPAHVELLHEPTLLPPTRYVSDHHGPAEFRRTPEQERQWQEMAASADIAFEFPDSNRYPHAYAPNLKWVQTTSAGVGQMVTRLGITPGEFIITTASGVHARPLAEFVFMVLLMAVKDHQRLAAGQQAHHWERFCADELSGKTLAIIGPGKIGQEVARIGRCFDMHPVALGRDVRPERAARIGVDRLFTRDELPEMLGMADALVLCAPHTPETENIMDQAAFDALKPGVILVNIGRGPLVDEEVMLGKLKDGTIRFAGLDVFRIEPLPADSPFWDLPNVIVNPHSASTSIHENGRIVEIFVHNLACFLDGRFDEMRNVLDIARMY
ncbi:MAG TPA: D-2-hydroxyacid dehydrogenase [Thermomicrobiales bacterium]|nr:D-2-hydroxyacid dehydrogenase [Thermomicrobiales bacterium]